LQHDHCEFSRPFIGGSEESLDEGRQGELCQLGRQRLLYDFRFQPSNWSSVKTVTVRQSLRQELMSCVTYPTQINLRFSDSKRKALQVSAGIRPGDLTCEVLHFFTT